MDFVRTVVAADMAGAERFLAASAGDELKAKVQNAIDVLSGYQIENLEIASSREWRSGRTDRRVEVRFQFRPKEATDDPVRIGLITVRAEASGGLFSVSDVILDQPAQ
jgi:hypothetical protein